MNAVLESLSSIDHLLGLTHVFVRDRESRIVYWGAGAQKLYGWSARDAIGRISYDLLKTEFPIPREEIEQIVEQAGSWEGNLTHITRSGEPKRMASHWQLYHQAPASDFYIFEDNNDVTQLSELAEQRDEALKQAREAVKSRDVFLTTVAHELRTPLNVVQLAADAARLTLRSNQEQTARNLERAVNGVRSISVLIGSLLDSVRVSCGRLELEKRPLDLRTVVCSAVEMMLVEAEAKGVKIRTDLPKEPMMALGDEERLDECVRNLLSNAIKFTSFGGHIELTIARRGEMVELLVADNGEGINPAFIPQLFDSMTKAPDSENNRNGLGLGLFITKNIIELHGGDISAFSPGKGRGATFTITLPVLRTKKELNGSRRSRRSNHFVSSQLRCH